MTRKDRNRNCRGYSLVELLLVLGAVGSIIAGVMYVAAKVSTSQKVNQTNSAVISMVSSLKKLVYDPSNSYSGVNADFLIKAGIVQKPFTAGTNKIYDAWGNEITIGSSQNFVGVGINAPDSDTCINLASAMADNAIRITVDTATPNFSSSATNASDFLNAGTVVKADATAAYNATAAAEGCSNAAGRHIGLVFR